AEVIGIAADARFRSLAEAPVPMYVVQRGGWGGNTVLIRTGGDPELLRLLVRGAMAEGGIPLSLSRLDSMEEVLQESLTLTRAVSDTVMVIGLLALLLAALGLYGVVAYVMAGRTREFGIRIALGARAGNITRMVLGYGLRLALIGGTLGVLLGVGALRVISGMLGGNWSSTAMTAAAAVLLSLVAILACLIPARRAAATSPVNMLRSE
ncbi:MAG TPA: FtsX-like permease family protein, partial [Gemmatimonadales bacterium]